MGYKVDFHTHSIASPDGGLSPIQYRQALATGKLHCIAVTDHNTIDLARALHTELGNQIIVGEEITTAEGEIIGLFLREVVPANLSAAETVSRIHAQGGLVYIPHPFETMRSGMGAAHLGAISEEVDIMEVHNGRAVFQNRSKLATEWARQHHIPGAASSDAHGYRGWGRTYTELTAIPTVQTLLQLLPSSHYQVGSPGLSGILYPKMNRIKKWKQHA